MTALVTSCLKSVLLLLATGVSPQDAAPAAEKPLRMLIVGGGGTTDAIQAHALKMIGSKKGARVLVMPQASERNETGRDAARMWKKAGFKTVEVLDLRKKTRAKKQIARATFIWMPGGSQSRLMAMLENAKLIQPIRERVQSGILIGGTSAGAAVMSKVMIARGRARAVSADAFEFGVGFGFLRGAILDQHFFARARFNRLLSAVLEKPKLLGIGIDEKTAIAVTGDTFEVVGANGVMVVDAGTATPTTPEAGSGGTWTGVRLALLRPGDRFDLAKRELLNR